MFMVAELFTETASEKTTFIPSRFGVIRDLGFLPGFTISQANFIKFLWTECKSSADSSIDV